MRQATLLPALLLCLLASGCAVQSVGVETPDASVRVSVRTYPDLVLVPGSPVYYAPWVDQNYFFYDGMYWVFQGDNWYASYWFNGPWSYMRVDYVPVFILRVPVYYYRRPPVYFRGWRAGEPPRWGEHWGRDWEERHPDWRRHDGAVPPPAPLPDYQRRYSGSRYPAPAQQQALRKQHYAWQPRERVELSGNPRPDRAQEPGRQQPEQRQQQWRQEREGRAQERLQLEPSRRPEGELSRPDSRPLRADDPRQGDRGREQRDAERQRIEQWQQQRDNDRQVQEQWRQRQTPPFREPERQRPDVNAPAQGQERPGRRDEREARDEEQQRRQEQWRQWQERQRRQQEQDAPADFRGPEGRQPEFAPQADPRGQRPDLQWQSPPLQRPDVGGDRPRRQSPEAVPQLQRAPAAVTDSAPQRRRDVLPAPSRREPPAAPAVLAPPRERGVPGTGGAPGEDDRPARKEAPPRKPTRGQGNEERAQENAPGS